jgi:replicative DNA helicase
MSEVKKHVRIPPNDIDAEQATLGSIMLNPSALNDIVDLVQAETFYSEKHRIIFKAMIDLFSKNEPIDLLSLSTSLKNREQLEQIGGRVYLTDLTNSVPASTNVKHYAKIVYRKNLMRKLIEAGEHLSNVGFSESDEDVETLMDEAEKKVFSITGDPKGQNFVSLKQSLHETWEHLEKLHDSKDGALGGVPTGFPSLDNLLGGLHKSDLIILAARPSVGKTTLALDIARNAAVKSGVPVGIFSLEMSAQQLTQRMLSAQAHVDAWKLRTGKLTAESDFQKIRDSMNELSKAPIYIDDQAGNSIIKMKSVARRLKSEFGLGLIVVDYLQLMATNKNYDSMVNQVTEISRSLKGLARELDVPVLALSQLSRAVESRGGKPRLSDLRDSGSIEQDADVVMFIHREDRAGTRTDSESTGIAEILVEKHRNGPVGKADLYFDEKNSTFLSIDKNNDYGVTTKADVDDAFDSF